jgi:N12 class adenine-specific DNA methylase
MTITAEVPATLGALGRARASVEALRVLAGIRREGREMAYPDELQALAGWSGWGPLAPAFSPATASWADIYQELNELLPAADVKIGMQGTFNAFYTPEPIAAAMWKLLAATGFTGGAVLEPGCGPGVFIDTAPSTVDMVGVERDPTAAAICRLRHPGAQVINKRFERTRITAGFDAVIGNVPFGNVGVHDANAPNLVRSSLHDYFIWRSLALLAPGGVAVLLTSRHTMDKAMIYSRAQLSDMADLIGAFRLPGGALGGGTDVVADVLILRRKVEYRKRGYAWVDVHRDHHTHDWVNTFWAECPGAVLGAMDPAASGPHGPTVRVQPRPGDPPVAQMLTDGAASIAMIAWSRELTWTPQVDPAAPPAGQPTGLPEGWHEGTTRVQPDGTVQRAEDGQLVTLTRPSKELVALLGLRDLAVDLVTREADHTLTDEQLTPVRQATAAAYTAYVAHYGPLNRCKVEPGPVDEETGLLTFKRTTPPMGGFRKDPDSAIVFALEVFDDDTGEHRPAPILSARQNRLPDRPARTDDPAQALTWCLDRTGGRVDLALIAGLLGIDGPPDELVPPILGDGIFQDPATLTWMSAGEYLSGNVRRKLATAEQAAVGTGGADSRFARNVAALTAVLPPWLGPAEITVNLGAPWIPASDVGQFVKELLGQDVTVKRIAGTGQWELTANRFYRTSVAATVEWGTPQADAFHLVELALNGRTPTVYKTVYINRQECQRKDPEGSLLASTKQAAIKDRFGQWIWEDPARTERLVHTYNHRFNSLAARRFDGEHVTVDGVAPWFEPYRHQLEMVARAAGTPATLCGHPVGAGKTTVMALTAAKLRQLGLIHKPMAVVPNHLREQVEREIRQLLPAARILSVDSGAVAADRRAFTARCATRDWDLILVTHAAFDRMPVTPQTEERYIAAQIAELEEAVWSAAPSGYQQGRTVKNLAKRIENLEVRLRDLRTRAKGYDNGTTFEATGVDYLIVDEAHYYKNLAVPVRTDGFSVRPSKRATDLEVKLSWLARRARRGGGHGRYLMLLTGTPVSNTLLELYILLRYLMPEQLDEIDLRSADAWAAAFVQMVTSVDVTVDGGQFKLATRPALFVNVPELRMLLSQVADIRTREQLGLPGPVAVNEVVAVDPTAAQRAYSADLVQRVDQIKQRGMFTPSDDGDNMLAVCGDGRRVATDPALVGLADSEPGKLDEVAARMLAVYRRHPDVMQIGFCDVGTPNEKKGAQTYGRLRDKLVAGGIPAGRIRFVHEAKTGLAKAQLFADCRAGRVSIVLGSTEKLGVGTNIQRLVRAMHHIDAPFRPADVQQRDGRGIRPGNLHSEVLIYRYVTKRTFDAYMWQMLARKAAFIAQVVSGSPDRTVQDVGQDMVDLFYAIKATATDQPLLIEQAGVAAEVKRLQVSQRGHQVSVRSLRLRIEGRELAIRDDAERAERLEAIAAWATPFADGDVALLHQRAQAATRGYSPPPPLHIGGVSVTFDTWKTFDKDAERQPTMLVDGGAGPVKRDAFRSWPAERLGAELATLLTGAATEAAGLRARITEYEATNAYEAQVAARPFADQDRLIAAQARLDQIDAALAAAALHKPDTVAVSAPPGAERAPGGAHVNDEQVNDGRANDGQPDGPPAGDDTLDPATAAFFADLQDEYDDRLNAETIEALAGLMSRAD